MVTASYQGGNSSFIRDYNRSKSTNYSADAPKGINQNSSNNLPANITFTAAQALAPGYTTGSRSYVLTGGGAPARPTRSPIAPPRGPPGPCGRCAGYVAVPQHTLP